MSKAGNHLFEIAPWGASYRGQIESETETTWLVRYKGERFRRVQKSRAFDILLPAGTDPDAALEAWRGAYEMHSHTVTAARDAFVAAKDRRTDAARSALIGEAQL